MQWFHSTSSRNRPKFEYYQSEQALFYTLISKTDQSRRIQKEVALTSNVWVAHQGSLSIYYEQKRDRRPGEKLGNIDSRSKPNDELCTFSFLIDHWSLGRRKLPKQPNCSWTQWKIRSLSSKYTSTRPCTCVLLIDLFTIHQISTFQVSRRNYPWTQLTFDWIVWIH